MITKGYCAKNESLPLAVENLERMGISVHDSERGGCGAFLGPGQLVVYPILNLKVRMLGPTEYTRLLEQMLVELLSRYHILGEVHAGYPGVWTSASEMIASIGVAVSRGVSYHGAMLNCTGDLTLCNLLKPFGLESLRMVSMESVSGQSVSLYELQQNCIRVFEKVFSGKCRIFDTLPEDMALTLGIRPCAICWSCGACAARGIMP